MVWDSEVRVEGAPVMRRAPPAPRLSLPVDREAVSAPKVGRRKGLPRPVGGQARLAPAVEGQSNDPWTGEHTLGGGGRAANGGADER